MTTDMSNNSELIAEAELYNPETGVLGSPGSTTYRLGDLITRLATALSTAQGEVEAKTKALEQSEAALAVVRQSLIDQAAARIDRTTPILTQAVVDGLRLDSEATHALAATREERVRAHGLSLLCDWQDKARSALARPPQGGDGT